ncbi:MAG: phosphoribosyl-ATP diphosphatase [Candidatus Melainabacteria bacterium]|nr:phosphoribosyl-ATP diphosphatase [Candidatus Melainabacteria bacterium]
MIIPSIDIMNGKAVQLKQGKELVLESERTPLELAREFNRFGEIAVIDLDAAMGKGDNRALIRDICKISDARVGGGIRDAETGREYLKAGAKALIFGTAACPEILREFPLERVMVALDQRGGKVVDKGWTESTGETVWERAERLTPYCGSFLTTFVEDEGGLGGIDMQAVREAKDRLKRPVTVAGGIAATDEVVEISKLGLDVQVGMALYTGRIDLAESVVGAVKFDGNGLVPIVVQDVCGKVLMLAYGSKESLKRALTEGKGVYFSRSRQEIWEKGLTSGSVQELVACRLDCDRDSILFTVKQTQGACHSGFYSCFGNASAHRGFAIADLFETLRQRKETAPEGSYSATLFKDRDKLTKKLMEEAFEVVSFKSRENLRWEIADLLYFVSLLAVDEGLDWKEIELELGGRRK